MKGKSMKRRQTHKLLMNNTCYIKMCEWVINVYQYFAYKHGKLTINNFCSEIANGNSYNAVYVYVQQEMFTVNTCERTRIIGQ